MKTKLNAFQISPLWMVLCGMLVLIALWSSRVVTAADNEAVLPLSILQQLIDNNRNSLPNCHLEWEISEKGRLPLGAEELILPSNPGTTSTYASDRHGSKYAITATEQKVTKSGKIIQTNSRSVFNGTEFRSLSNEGWLKLGIAFEAKFHPNENWLEVIEWNDSHLPGDLAGGKISHAHVGQSILVDNGNTGRLQELIYTDSQDGSKLIAVFNIDKGGCKQSERWINAKGQEYYRWESEVSEVMDGVWLPTAISSWSMESQSGKVALERKAKLNLPACRFGDAYQPDEAVFELPIEDNMEVVDLRAGTRVTYKGSDAPTSLADLKQRIVRGDATISESVPIERVNIQRHPGATKWLLIINGVCLIVIAIVVALVWWRRG